MGVHENLYRLVASRIRQEREAAGLSQQELAEKTKLTRAAIANFENRRQNIGLHVIYLLSDVLNVSPSKFLPTVEELRGENLGRAARHTEIQVAIDGEKLNVEADLYAKLVNALNLEEVDGVTASTQG